MAFIKRVDETGLDKAAQSSGLAAGRCCSLQRLGVRRSIKHRTKQRRTLNKHPIDASPTAWSLPERHLATELAVGLARRLNAILGGSTDAVPAPGYVFHHFTTDFEDACDVLWGLGVAYAAYGSDPDKRELAVGHGLEVDSSPCYFRFFSEADIRSRLSDARNPPSVSLQEILESYIAIACGYGVNQTQLSCSRGPFAPQSEYAKEIEALARLGYVERRGLEVAWRDKIGEAMENALLWQADGQTRREVEEAALAVDCAAVLAATPELLRNRLRKEAKRLSMLDFVHLLGTRYEGLYLKTNPDGSDRVPEGDGRILMEVYKALRNGP